MTHYRTAHDYAEDARALALPTKTPWHRRLRCWLGAHEYTVLDLVEITLSQKPSEPIGVAQKTVTAVRLECFHCGNLQKNPMAYSSASFDMQLQAHNVFRTPEVREVYNAPDLTFGHMWVSAKTLKRV